LDQLDDRCLLSGFWPAQPQSSGYTPAQVAGAYGLSAITLTSSKGTPVPGNGGGETIAVVEMYHDPTIQSDLQTFDAKYDLPNPALTQVNQGGNQTDSGWTP
jgi:subtilase family serine protease